jgi:hypothetical protein
MLGTFSSTGSSTGRRDTLSTYLFERVLVDNDLKDIAIAD